ncbi:MULTISPECIES: acetyl-CoA carboxylase biotin carboxyl carrier protein [unclassified Sporosarcina]|uniref:acetyl-CoA carboxylase biotin carboxyl carrier protein n=1 Tax=unclassified Sporosarcina TaxID=2647733 RepID=UPI000C162B89|nr:MULTISPECIES: acetyl-CoA carboxylase biotin carboxyl carrier protein [unclassified Sporosarcina]PID03544.1 acetyl-CoA carboxylase, biotin carboxyl carrier protein [Sporosarcina sp. P2]PID23500.1 acetyl-CoA carboxylase, biotin carboxyl carrier protein [Sporosarcina sp. P7]
MLKIQEIREIIKLIDQSSIQKFSLESDGGKIKLEKNGGQAVTTVTEAPQTPQAAPAPVQAPVETATVAPTPAPEAPAAPAAEVAIDETLHKITSPMVGTFYKASSPDAEAYVKTGDKVTAESIVCIVEAMKLFNEIESEVHGEIVEILVQDGQLVEYGQPLFLVREN